MIPANSPFRGARRRLTPKNGSFRTRGCKTAPTKVPASPFDLRQEIVAVGYADGSGIG